MNRFKATVARIKKENEQRRVLKAIDSAWIISQMQELNISRTTIEKDLLIDKSSLSLFLANKRKLNKSVKAAFFYYFSYKRLQKEQLNQSIHS